MTLFLLNIVLALIWSAAVGSFEPLSLAFGFVVGYAALWVARPLFGETTYFERFNRCVSLAGFFLWDLLVSSLYVAWDVITPRLYSRPGIISVPLDAKTDVEILTVANLISLTPGTLSLDVSADRRKLYIHVMFLDDPEALRRDLKAGIERRILEAYR